MTLNHGTAGSSPATGAICLVSLMDKTEDFYSPALGSTPRRGAKIYRISSMDRVSGYEPLDRGSTPLSCTKYGESARVVKGAGP